jgi:hypothetical protein
MIIAIGHEPNVGKDSFVMFATDYLRQKFKGLDIQREGFADRAYDTCYSLYSWAGFKHRTHYIQYPHEKEIVLPKIGKTPRQLLIAIAEKIREFDPQAWLMPVFMNKPKHLKFIPDLRTIDEIRVARQTDTIVVKINRPDKPKIECKTSAILKDYQGWDYVIENTGSLSEFRDSTLKFITTKVESRLMEILRNAQH